MARAVGEAWGLEGDGAVAGGVLVVGREAQLGSIVEQRTATAGSVPETTRGRFFIV